VLVVKPYFPELLDYQGFQGRLLLSLLLLQLNYVAAIVLGQLLVYCGWHITIIAASDFSCAVPAPAAPAAAAAVCSVAAVVLGQLPGDWGFFTSYLTGAIVLVVLAVGSTAPGLLQVGLSV
jgi:hypothetical protein